MSIAQDTTDAEFYAWQARIDDIARQLLHEPTLDISAESADDQDEIRGRATDMTLSLIAQARWAQEEEDVE